MIYIVQIYCYCFLLISWIILNYQRYVLIDKYLIMLFEEYRVVLINIVYFYDIIIS